MGLFSRKTWPDDKVRGRLLKELSFASRFPSLYTENPETLADKLDRIISRADRDFVLPEELRDEIDSVVEYVSYPKLFKSVSGRDVSVPPYEEFILQRNENRKRIEAEKEKSEEMRKKTEKVSAAKRHGIEQKALIEKFRRDGYDGKRWVSEGDFDVRPSHRRVNGQIRPLNEPFDLPDGVRLMHPGDPKGAKKEIDGCRCGMVPVRLSRGDNGTYKK